MTSKSSVRELPPGDPELTASIVSHLKSRGLFDKLRRDCLGDVDTKPAYLNLKQRIEGYITKFLSTQTWTPDMNKNHVRDMMRREINESGMLSAGMDHLVDQIVNPKVYQVFTLEVENGVRQYLGLSSAKDSSTQQPKPEAATDTTSRPRPQTPPIPTPPLPPPPLPPLPPKSEFSIDETTQDVPGSCSPKPYIEAFTPDDFTDSSEPHLMIVTDNSERTDELPAEFPFQEAASADLRDTSADPAELVPNETAGEAPAREQTGAVEPVSQVVCPSGNADQRLPAEDLAESFIPLDDIKSDLLSEVMPIEVDKKDGEMIADMTKKEIRPIDRGRKERKLDSGKGRESNSHSSRSESHSKTHMPKKSSNVSRSKSHKSRGDGDLTRESRDVCKEKDRHTASQDKGSSSRVETSRNKTDVSKDERSKVYSSQSSRSKESCNRSERKRSDDRHRHYSSSQSHYDKKRHSDKHSREEKSRDRSESHRSHSESRKDKDGYSTRIASRQHKPNKASEKHGESSRRDKGHEKKRKDYGRQNSSDSRDDGVSKKVLSENTMHPMCHNSVQEHDSTSCHVDMPETSIQDRLEIQTNFYDSSQLSFLSASQDSSLGMVKHVAQKASKEDILDGTNQSEKVDVQAAEEISQETYDECSHGALQLVEAKEAEILRFSYVTDKASGNGGIGLQLVDAVTDEQPQAVPVLEDSAQLKNGDERSGFNDAALLDVPEQVEPLKEKCEATRRKNSTEKNSPERKRPRREASDGHESDAAWSDVTVSSVHTSDLSSYDDCISVSSADEDDCAIVKEKKKIPLREIKKITSSSNEDDDRMSRSETEPLACDGAVPLPVVPEEVAECEPPPGKELQPACSEPLQSSNTEKVSRLSSSPSTATSDGAPEPKMGLRRTRKINPKYASEEFSSIFTEGKRPVGTIDFCELAKCGKERHHEDQTSLRAETRKVSSREDASDDLGAPMSCDETDQFSDTSVTDRRRPARRPSGSEPQPRSESTSSKRYQSSDLYKPRPIIVSRRRRSRPSPTEQATPKTQRGLKVCIGAKRGRPPTAGSSRGKRL